MFGTQSYLDKSMNGIKTIFDGAGAVIQNGNATFNNITVTTLTADNLSDCNLVNCTADDPTDPQDIANKEYCDDNFVNRTNNLNQDINGIKTFLSVPICSIIPNNLYQLVNKNYCDITFETLSGMINYVDRSTDQNISGIKTFTGTIKSNNYDTNIATNPLNIGQSNTTGEIKLGRNQTSGGKIAMGTGFSETIIYGSIKLHATTIEDGSILKSRIIESSAPLSAHHKLFNDMGINAVLTIGNVLSSNVINGNTTFNNQLISNNITAPSSTVAGNNNIYTNLTETGKIYIGNLSSSNVIAGDTTFSSDITTPNIFCGDALYLNDYQSGTTYSSILVQNTDILNFDANFNNNKFQFKVSSNAVLLLDATNTTIYNNLNFNAGSRYNNGTNYTTFDQVGTQLTIKPVSINGSIALYSTNLYGVQTQQLLVNNIGITTTTVTSTNFLGENYNTNSQIIYFGPSITTGNIFIGGNTTTGNINIGNATAGSFKTNIRGSLFSTGQATFQNFCPKSETNPAVANDLVKLSYLQNNFCDLSTPQAIGGVKTFSGDITAPNINCNIALYFTDIGNNLSPNKPQILMLNDVVYFDTLANYDNYWEFVCVGNIQLSISQYSTEIKNPLILYEYATFSKQATFNNFCPKTDTDPAVANDLVKLSYLENNFCDLSTPQSIGGAKTFTSDTIFSEATTFESTARFNNSINIYNGVNNSNINQTTNILNIKNLFSGGSISLQTAALISGAQDRLTISHISCDILPSTLNLTGTSPISILCPNNLSGEINLFNDLTSGGNINFGSANSTCNFNSDTTFVGNIFCSNALYLNDYQAPTTYSSILVQNTDILNFDANFNNNKFQFKVSSNAVLLLESTNTTIYNDLNSLSNATFSGDVTLRTTKILNKVKIITTTSSPSFPMEETILINSSSNFTITLPEITSTTQTGTRFLIKKGITNSNIITLQRTGTSNTIIPINSFTGASSNNTMLGAGTYQVNLIILEQTAGVFSWVQI